MSAYCSASSLAPPTRPDVQHPIAVARGGAEHRLGMAGDIDRQRLLHRAGRDMSFRHLVVLAVVAEEIPAERQVEDLAELLGHFEILA